MLPSEINKNALDYDPERDNEKAQFYPPTDYELSENQAEKKKLLQEVVLPVVQRRLGSLYDGMHYDGDNEGVHMNYEAMRAEILLALDNPLEFVKAVSSNSVKHFDAGSMVSNNVTAVDAADLVVKAMANLNLTHQELRNL